MRTRAVLAAVAFGVISDLAFDPVNLSGAMIIGVAGFLLLLLRNPEASIGVVALLGAAYGVGLFAPLLWWMNVVGHSAYVGIVLSQLGFFALLAVGLRLIMRLSWWPLWGACLWVGVESLRSSFPFSGFPWGRLAFTGVGTPIESYARLVGVPGMGAVMFLLAASLACFASRPGAKTGLKAVATGSTLLLVGTLLPSGIAGEQGSRQVALVQGDVPGLKGHWQPGQIFQKHADETENLIADIAIGKEPRPDFVLWPENSTDIDPAQFPSVSGLLDLLVQGLNAPILVGGLLDGPDDQTAYNAGLVWDRGGEADKYFKRKPVPYGEYVPFRSALGNIVPRLDRLIPRDMLPGHKSGAIKIAGVTIGDAICWDIAFDGLVRDNINHGAQVLVVQTSNASFTGTAQPEQQWRISRLRAIETGRYVLVPSTNGISGVVDAKGHTDARARTQIPAIVSAKITLANGVTPGVRYGGILETAMVILGLVGLVLSRRRGRGAE